MAVVGVDVGADGTLAGTDAALAAAARLPPGAPVAVMIHGYRYRPGTPRGCPHRSLYAAGAGWPAALALAQGDGLAVGLGWNAQGTLHGAYLRAGRAGQALAPFLACLRAVAPAVRIALIGHSLGARVGLAALRHARPGDADAAILLAPAEFAPLAQVAADSPGGRAARIVSVTSRENLPFDRGLGLLLAGGLLPTLHGGLPEPRAHWTDLALSDAAALARLKALGHPVAPPERRVCHWSAYTRPGAMPLYRAILDGSLPADRLAAALPPRPRLATPRALRLPRLPLPPARNAAS